MTLRLISVGLFLLVTLSQGAVLPFQEDALFDMVQSFLIQPDEFASAIGMTRNKRETSFDKDFNLDALGARLQIKYIDPANRLKGGQAVITIQNLKQYIPQAKTSKVVLTINFNSGDSPKDGLFTMSVDYELHHKNVEKGTLKLVRVKDGALWKSEVSVTSTNNAAVKIIPVFSVTLKSDRRTLVQGAYTCEHGNKYSINIDRTPGKSIKAVIEGNGRTYIVNGVLDIAEKKVHIDIDANGQKYKVDIDGDDSGSEVKFVANVNLANFGSYKVELNGDKSMTAASMKISYNGRDFASAKAKGSFEGESVKYELRYSAAGIGEGKLRFSLTDRPQNKEVLLQYLPKTGLDLSVQLTVDLKSAQSVQIHSVVKRGGEVYLEYKYGYALTITGESYEMKEDTELSISRYSVLYSPICKIGCINNMASHTKVNFDINAPHKFSIDVQHTKDKVPVLALEVNTRHNPFIFKLNAPALINKILSSGKDSIEIEADHNPGQYLKIKSNTNILKSFKIEKLANDMRRVELNGKELMQAKFKKGANSISQTTTLPDGRSLTTTISWESENLKANKINIKLDGTERKLDAVVSWDVRNPAAVVLHADGKGKNARWGKYSLLRDVKLSSKNGKFSGELTGNSSFDNAPWPSPVKTDINIKVDTNTQDYTFVISKNVAGRNYGATFQNGKLSINL